MCKFDTSTGSRPSNAMPTPHFTLIPHGTTAPIPKWLTYPTDTRVQNPWYHSPEGRSPPVPARHPLMLTITRAIQTSHCGVDHSTMENYGEMEECCAGGLEPRACPAAGTRRVVRERSLQPRILRPRGRLKWELHSPFFDMLPLAPGEWRRAFCAPADRHTGTSRSDLAGPAKDAW